MRGATWGPKRAQQQQHGAESMCSDIIGILISLPLISIQLCNVWILSALCVVCAFLNKLVGWRWWALSYGIIALVVFPGCDYSAIIITRDFYILAEKSSRALLSSDAVLLYFIGVFKIWMAPELPVITLIESANGRSTSIPPWMSWEIYYQNNWINSNSLWTRRWAWEKAIQFIHVKKWNSSKIYIFIE